VSNPKSANPEAEKEIGRNKMYSEIAALPKEATNVAFNNRVPHASLVESGGWVNTPAYGVYSGTVSEFPRILQEAKARVGLK
jgi:hypothetical protein